MWSRSPRRAGGRISTFAHYAGAERGRKGRGLLVFLTASGGNAFFAAKAVVDDGDKNKGDSFHRIGCLLSAKFVAEAIRSGISDVWND